MSDIVRTYGEFLINEYGLFYNAQGITMKVEFSNSDFEGIMRELKEVLHDTEVAYEKFKKSKEVK